MIHEASHGEAACRETKSLSESLLLGVLSCKPDPNQQPADAASEPTPRFVVGKYYRHAREGGLGGFSL